MFSAEAASEKITYTHVVSKGKTEEKHYGEYSTEKNDNLELYTVITRNVISTGLHNTCNCARL